MTASNPTVWVTLRANDAPRLIEFYRGVLGFILAARYGEGDVVDHAQLNWPEGSGGVMLGSHRHDAEYAHTPGTAGAYIVTADPAGLYARILQHDVDVVRSLCETPYGATEFTVRDPEGNLWSFGDYPGVASPATA